MAALATIVAIIILWGVFSRPLDRRGITSAMVFVGAGLLVGSSVLGCSTCPWRAPPPNSSPRWRSRSSCSATPPGSTCGRCVTSSRGRRACSSSACPSRMLAGTGVGLLVFPGMALASVVPALDDALLHRRGARPEGRHRRLRPGPRPPGARRGERAQRRPRRPVLPRRRSTSPTPSSRPGSRGPWSATPPFRSAGGSSAGVVAGLLGALLFRAADKRGWIGSEWRQIVPLAAALLAYALAVTLGGSGFIAAFVGGMAFGGALGCDPAPPSRSSRKRRAACSPPSPGSGSAPSRSAWSIPHVTWQVVLYAAAQPHARAHGAGRDRPARARASGGPRWPSSAGSGRGASPPSCSRSWCWREACPRARPCSPPWSSPWR